MEGWVAAWISGLTRELGSHPAFIFTHSHIQAATGNESSRPLFIAPVGRPANSSTSFAVAAVDSLRVVAAFSNSGINPNGDKVNVAAEVGVHASLPMPRRYVVLSMNVLALARLLIRSG
jgi:hypothetical protein